MLNEMVVPSDGVALARSVRAIAARARRALDHPTDLAESRELLIAIDRLERDEYIQSTNGLPRWLASLRRRIEGLAMSID